MILSIPKLGRPYENVVFEDNMQLFHDMAKSIKNYYFDIPVEELTSPLGTIIPTYTAADLI